MKRLPTLEWQTNGVCNYDCPYCIQSRKHRVGAPDEATLEAFLRFFHTLPGVWEIKMSGGEPFAPKAFMGTIVPGLMKTPHAISVLTNFSAPWSTLEALASLTAGRLRVFSASLHLGAASVEAFVEKAVRFVALVGPEVRFVVNSVVVPGQVARLVAVKAQVEAAGLRFFPQLMKTKTGRAEYPPEEGEALRALLGEAPDPWEANTAPDYHGRRCYAGVEYFVLSQQGDVFACRTAKRFGEGYLGNVLREDVTLWQQPRGCPYHICPCSVPAHRGMIDLRGLVSAERLEDDT